MVRVGRGMISLDGQTVWYTIKRSARAKQVRLEVSPETGLTVVVPRSCKLDLPDLLQRNKRWILGKLARRRQAQLLSARTLKSGDTISYLGQDLELLIRQNHSNATNAKLERHRLVVSLGLAAEGRLGSILEQWYRGQAAKLIKERADELSARLGLGYNRLVIRGQKTRWGSCSHRGNLSFNWRLIMAPQPVIDYVIIHELAHLKEMNHTERFWRLVAEQCPGWRAHKRWLKDHEAELAGRLSPSR